MSVSNLDSQLIFVKIDVDISVALTDLPEEIQSFFENSYFVEGKLNITEFDKKIVEIGDEFNDTKFSAFYISTLKFCSILCRYLVLNVYSDLKYFQTQLTNNVSLLLLITDMNKSYLKRIVNEPRHIRRCNWAINVMIFASLLGLGKFPESLKDSFEQSKKSTNGHFYKLIYDICTCKSEEELNHEEAKVLFKLIRNLKEIIKSKYITDAELIECVITNLCQPGGDKCTYKFIKECVKFETKIDADWYTNNLIDIIYNHRFIIYI
jgi:hypothetical protein